MAIAYAASRKRAADTEDDDAYSSKRPRQLTASPLRNEWLPWSSSRRNSDADAAMIHVADEQPKPSLMALPQELLDDIFFYAYPNDPTSKPIWKFHWKMIEMARQENFPAGYLLRRFKRLKVEEWSVSKRYFVLAATAWARAQTFEARSRLGCLDPCMQPQGVLSAFVQTAHVDLRNFTPEQIHWILDRIKLWPNLRRFFADINQTFQTDVLPHRQRSHWTEDEVECVHGSLGLGNFATLRSSKFHLRRPTHWTAQDRAILVSNFERVVQKERVSWLPSEDAPVSYGTPLYPGSEVCWGLTGADLARNALALQLSKLSLNDRESTNIKMSTRTDHPTMAEVCAAIPREGIDSERFFAMFRKRLRGRWAENDLENMAFLFGAFNDNTGFYFPAGVTEEEVF